MEIKLPELSYVALVGASSVGKSTFAKKHFLPSEVISSDYCRALVSDDENSMEATDDAFDVLNYIVGKRLKRGKLTVIDATNVQPHARQPIVALARQYHCLPVAIVLDLPLNTLKARHAERTDRDFGNHVIPKQYKTLKRTINRLRKEGFSQVYILDNEEDIANVTITRVPLWNNKKHEKAPFDIIGDIHGCFDELVELLEKLGYTVQRKADTFEVIPPEGRRAIFVGDLVDRGNNSPDVLRLVMSMVEAGTGFCVAGNHDAKLLKKLNGRNVQVKHGLAETLEQLEKESEEFVESVKVFLRKLISHYVLDGGRLVVAHAGLREDMQGRGSGAVRSFCLYGETTGEIDEFGLPVRYNWASEYRGKAMVVYGHTPIPDPEWLNNTINVDTGCVFGGRLTALRYPERELVSVEAKKVYAEPAKPLHLSGNQLSAQQAHDHLLDIADVTGKRRIQTKLGRSISIREENSIAALEVMTRFGVHPKWMVYLPPTMSPTETSALPDYLEHPAEAFAYYAKKGIQKIICEEKHMGSRAVIVLCKNEDVAKERFGLVKPTLGMCYTRTGRPFFKDESLHQNILIRLNEAMHKSDLWSTLNTDWVVLDCEIMPWTLKAQSLISQQYASVGVSGTLALKETIDTLKIAQQRGLSVDNLLEEYSMRNETIDLYKNSYRNYTQTVNSIDDIRIAPFHILASEGAVHTDKNHEWHMTTIHHLCESDEKLLFPTNYKIIDLQNNTEINDAIDWWVKMTENGGEGMVVKPYDFLAYEDGKLLQPAIKCRGKEYLRIIYGADYTLEKNLKRLKKRNLGRKRSMAMREFALGVEALERFVKNAPLRQVHECVFGVLALESEAVDPRL